MATEEIKAVKFTCDACGSTTLVNDGDPRPPGYHGTVSLEGGDGKAQGGSFFACKKGCIRQAILNVTASDTSEAPEVNLADGLQTSGTSVLRALPQED
jgi:hypothetical protein